MEKERAIEIWEELFGDREVAYDFASHPMKKEDFQNKDSHYGWDIDEKKPFLNREDNFIPCSLNTISFRGGKPSFKVGNNLFEVRKGKVYGTFDIYDVTDRNHPINMDPTDENQDPSYNRERFHQLAMSKNASLNHGFRVPRLSSIRENVLNQRMEENETTPMDYSFLFEDENETAPVVEETIEPIPTEEENSNVETKDDSIQELKIETETVTEEQPMVDSETNQPTVEENTKSIHPLISLDDEEDEEPQMLEATTETTQPVIENETDENKDSFYEEEIEKLKAEIKQNELELSKVQEENNQLQKSVDDLKFENQLLNEEKEKNAVSQEELNKETSIHQERMEELNRSNQALKDHILSMEQDSQNQKEKLDELQKSNENLSSELNISKEENVTLSTRLNKLDTEMENIQNEYSILFSNKEEMVTQISNLTEENIQLKNEVQELKAQNESLNQNGNEAVQNLNQQLNESNNHNQELLSQMELLRSSFQSRNVSSDEKIATLTAENEQLNQILSQERETKNGLQNQYDQLSSENEELKKNYDQVNAQSELVSEQLDGLNDENQRLTKDVEEKNIQIEEWSNKYQNLLQERQSLEEKMNTLKTENSDQERQKEAQIEFANEENQKLQAKCTMLSEKIVECEKKLEETQASLSSELSLANQETAKYKDQIDALQKETDLNARKVLFLSLSGKEEFYNDLENALQLQGVNFNAENIKAQFLLHPEWKKDVISELEDIHGTSQLIDQEKVSYLKEEMEQRNKANNFYDMIYSIEKYEISDFAGRVIRLADYRNSDSDYGWDYTLLDSNEKEEKDNVVIANLRTLKDFRTDAPFQTNGHTFQVLKVEGKKKVMSSDFVSDPFDFTEAIRITKAKKNQLSPLVYIFVKILGTNTAEPNKEDLMEFFDLLDCSAKRACPSSFVEMKTVASKENYALINFDGTATGCYKEVLDYALLLNSYRKQYKKENRLTAVIVLNEVEVSFSKRHLDYDALLSETKDDELRALKYEFKLAVINSTIKRTIHIGPRILDKLPLDQSLLVDSLIGQGDYAKMYNFNKRFKIYNFAYELTYKEDTAE
jgi:predicted  nucleic acid-binding Zn-ribbon protein